MDKTVFVMENKSIHRVKEEKEETYVLNGEFCPFEIEKARVKEFDKEAYVILNLYGVSKVLHYMNDK